eukprot:TRINITY_DN16335_c0_g1_i1.p2 TRINITY_DN16335_c0_g1~~TRINITY_DN16335_c0_g1_i1.p2  ORF type:complete len:125 (+),score=39.27 TRINITY_DN16335_c0_g1_i1:71-445(+)
MCIRDRYCIGDLQCFLSMVIDQPTVAVVQLVEGARRFREVFALFDEDDEGTISVDELTVTLTKLFRRRPTQFEMTELIKSVDVDRSGYIDFKEFCLMLLTKHKRRSVMETCLLYTSDAADDLLC